MRTCNNFTCLGVLPLLSLQLIQQLDEELGIEKFRMDLESTQVLVRTASLLSICMLLAAGPVSAIL